MIAEELSKLITNLQENIKETEKEIEDAQEFLAKLYRIEEKAAELYFFVKAEDFG